ncbi:MAG: hypothetical protein BAJALOKI1v1_50018 [Promethearchaeota archaeon]|nr:MAG: hypothetical protein BAJALOKI1v1_50018 [Candidatus Lokiarchaeota archaeon]
MGFKRISNKELKLSKAPAFLGVPVQYEGELDLLKPDDVKSTIEYSQKESNVFVLAEEILNYEYSKNGLLKKFEGEGTISIINNSQKNRIWDVLLNYSKTENIRNSEIFNKKGDLIALGNFEPQKNKNLTYQIKDSEDLKNPIKIFERIEVSNIEKENLGTQIKRRKIEKLEKEIEHKKEHTKKQIKSEFDSKIDKVQEKLDKEKKDMDHSSDKLSNYSKKEKELINDINDLESVLKKLNNEKAQDKRDIIGRYLDQKDLKKDISLLLRESQQYLTQLENELPTIKKDFSDKTEQLLKEINNRYNPKIRDAERRLEQAEKEYDRLTQKEKKLEEKGSNLKDGIKELKKDLKSLEDQLKITRQEKEIEQKSTLLEKTETKLSNTSDRLKDLKKSQKQLGKDIKSLTKERDKELENQEKEITDLKDTKVEEQEKKIQETKELIKGTEEIIDKYEGNINSYESQLKIKERELAKINLQIKQLKEVNDKIQDKIDELENEIKDLNKFKENRIKKELTILEEKKEEREQRIMEGYDDILTQKQRDNYYLLYNKLNVLKYSITIQNISNLMIEDIKLAKQFSEEFQDFKYETSAAAKVDIRKNTLIFSFDSIEPEKDIEITISTTIKPEERQIIGTGNIQLSYINNNDLISGLELKDLKGYSHAMHAIKIKEKEEMPNEWVCYLIFRNNSDIAMKLKSLLVLDQTKENKLLDHSFNSNIKGKEHILQPQDQYQSAKWEVKDKNEPKFYRKIDYSITHKLERKTTISLSLEESIFEIIDLNIEKKFLQPEIKSFEESTVECEVSIKNLGTIPAKGLIIKETIPKDFVPLLENSQYKITTSLGKDVKNLSKVRIVPENQDPSVEHEIKIFINLENIEPLELINIDEFLKLSYAFQALKPNHTKQYAFPIEVKSYYPKEQKSPEDFYYISKSLEFERLPKLKIIHQRRNLLIAKEIFPGRDVDEFAISLIVNNSSNIEINDIKIDDTLPKEIEVISSNRTYEVHDSEIENADTISFKIEKILPFQEEEIRYYVKNKNGEVLSQEKLESFLLS